MLRSFANILHTHFRDHDKARLARAIGQSPRTSIGTSRSMLFRSRFVVLVLVLLLRPILLLALLVGLELPGNILQPFVQEEVEGALGPGALAPPFFGTKPSVLLNWRQRGWSGSNIG